MNPFLFTATVSRRGHDVRDTVVNGNPCRVLSDCIKPGQRYRARLVCPLDAGPIHLDFSKIANEDQVIAFADRFGFLGLSLVQFDGSRGVQIGERVEGWLEQTALLRGALDLAYSKRRVLSETAINEALSQVQARMVMEKGPCLKIVPLTLLSAIWLQFALSLDMKRKYRRCKNCRAWIEISLGEGGRSARALYCSDGCKQQAAKARAVDSKP